MDRAIQKARSTYPEFVEALHKHPVGAVHFTIKKGFGAGEELEHIWLSDVSWNGKAFSAKVDNEPVDTKLVKLGDRVEVRPEELSDWMYIQDGKLVGGYTVRVLYYAASKEEQKELSNQMHATVPAIDF
ncbi:MAG: DUF2314 domain-containing protein [Planctomycetia bacterium]|nr:DUF2314 domain-containing protein [Planctomycetia bacterium]